VHSKRVLEADKFIYEIRKVRGKGRRSIEEIK